MTGAGDSAYLLLQVCQFGHISLKQYILEQNSPSGWGALKLPTFLHSTLLGLLHHFSVEIYSQICQIRHIIEWNVDLLFRWWLCCRFNLYLALLLLLLLYSNTSFVNLLHSHGSCCHFGRCSWLQVNWFLVDQWFQSLQWFMRLDFDALPCTQTQQDLSVLTLHENWITYWSQVMNLMSFGPWCFQTTVGSSQCVFKTGKQKRHFDIPPFSWCSSYRTDMCSIL
jgi:hypothetical protein